MATAVTADTYLQHIHTARTQLHECFRRAHELLAEREAHLLRELETIQNEHESETKSQQEELRGLEVSKQTLKTNLRDNDLLNKALADINLKILKLSYGTARTIRFHWNADLDRNLQQAGEIITTPQPNQSANLTPVILPPANHYTPDYKNKSSPTITCCKHNKGNAPGELNCPRGLAVDPQSGRIYIADSGNNRVQVFTPNGEYCFMFSGYMNTPWGICINNDTVYVSQWMGHCITAYKLHGEHVNKFGSQGAINGQFDSPRGLAVSPATGLLYVCDYSNHRVQVFDNKLKFHSLFAYKLLNNPSDITFTNDLIIILDAGNPCVHIFSITDHSLINSVISCGVFGWMSIPLFFTMDAQHNLLLTDYDKHCVRIFSLSGKFISVIGKKGDAAGRLFNPAGIAIDEQNRIIVMNENANASLHIY